MAVELSVIFKSCRGLVFNQIMFDTALKHYLQVAISDIFNQLIEKERRSKKL